ncbi:hypothetical protein HDC90_000865 [Pedobacter sp. AK013]|uniref:hypothetical protein n=1 Tax=Pedobacter sp. AK013 TaxID=2723071 RepID=UPI0016195015|nr:hypothetical protein [Pedobacter sp. AK013]MBB6236254.1 hypothetical protein [Pedobacter sp. AK013]
MNNRKITFFIVLLIAISGFLIFYPLRFDLYECAKAKKIIDYITLSVGISGMIYFIYRKLKSGDYILLDSMVKTLFLIIIIYFIVVRSLLGCALTFMNSIYERNEVVKIKGVVIKKIEKKGRYKSVDLYELTIQDQTGREIILETKPSILKNYVLNDRVEIDMKKGILNLLYR